MRSASSVLFGERGILYNIIVVLDDYIYCSMKRLVGFNSESDDIDSDKLRHCLVGGHVADYMRYLSENDEEKYKSHFSRFIKEGVTADSVSSSL